MASKFLFVSYDGLIADIAWQVVKEGHEAKLLDPGPGGAGDRPTASCPRPNDWKQGGRLGRRGRVRRRARRHGRDGRGAAPGRQAVVGGSPYTDRLEDDRAFGQQELKAAGVPIIPQENFTSFDDAIAYVQANPNRYVIKPSGEAQNIQAPAVRRRGGGRARRDPGAGGLQARLAGQDQGVPAAAPHHRRRGRGGRVLQRHASSSRRSASTSSTRSCSRATSARRPARWAPRCSGAEPNRLFNATLKKMEPRLAAGALRRLHRRQLHRQRERHLPAGVHLALRLPDDQHPAGRPAHADRRAAAQARRRLADAGCARAAASRSACASWCRPSPTTTRRPSRAPRRTR